MTKKSFNIDFLKIFLAVSDAGSMSEAAKRHGLTQSGVSRAISALELQFGERLFDRSTNPISLTAMGRFLRQRSLILLEAVEGLERDVESFRKNQTLDLRLGTSTSVTMAFTPHILLEMTAQFPHVSSSTGNTFAISKQLLDDEIDIAICSEGHSAVRFLSTIPLYTEEYLVILPREEDSTVSSLADLLRFAETHPCAQFNYRTLDAIHTGRVLRQWGVRRQALEVNSIESALLLVSSGRCWSLMPAVNIVPADKHFPLVSFRHLSAQQGIRTMYLHFKSLLYRDVAYLIRDTIYRTWKEAYLPRLQKTSPLLAQSVKLLE